jgi:hypothetical protein
MRTVAPRMNLFNYISCHIYVQNLVDGMVQNLVHDGGQCCIYVYIFCYIYLCLECLYICVWNACIYG